MHHAKLILAYGYFLSRVHEAVSVLNEDASGVNADIRFGIIGGAAYGAHKIAHCKAAAHQDT